VLKASVPHQILPQCKVRLSIAEQQIPPITLQNTSYSHISSPTTYTPQRIPGESTSQQKIYVYVWACHPWKAHVWTEKYTSTLFSISNFKSINFTYLMLKWIGWKVPATANFHFCTYFSYENNSIFPFFSLFSLSSGETFSKYFRIHIDSEDCLYANGNCMFPFFAGNR
jgi:hypothetical protein